MESIVPILVIVSIIFSIVSSKKKKQAQENAKAAAARKAESNKAQQQAQSVSEPVSSFSGMTVPVSRPKPRPVTESSWNDSEAHQGEDTCHEEMLTGPISREEADEIASLQFQNNDLVRGMIIAQVLSAPVSARRRL